MSGIQYRFRQGIELRAQDPAKTGAIGTIAGYASVFDSRSEPMELWDGAIFYEVIKRGAFAKSLAEDDIRALGFHKSDGVIGRLSAKTLRISEDEKGLFYEVDLPDTTVGRDLFESIKRRDVDASSFGMSEITDTWSRIGTERGVAVYQREITQVRLWEVSPVTWPAYAETSVQARSGLLLPGDERAELIKRAKAVEGGEDAGVERVRTLRRQFLRHQFSD